MPHLFSQPARQKLFFQLMQDQKNSGRIARKPVPVDVMEKFHEHAKEYAEFKTAEAILMRKEEVIMVNSQLKSLDATIFLPDYLMNEVYSDTGATTTQDMKEFRPAALYTEQVLRILPYEQTLQIRMIPGFEESFMKFEDERKGEGTDTSAAVFK